MNTSEYISIKRLKDKVVDGDVNIPAFTLFDVDEDNFIYYIKDGEKIRICWKTSQRAFDYFSYNADGYGELRYKLLTEIFYLISRLTNDEKFEGFKELYNVNNWSNL